MSENEIQKYQQTTDALQALSPDAVLDQIKMVQELMSKVMKKDEHYGIIPGCGTKPTLLKAGAEKLNFTFRLAPKYTVTMRELKNDHREYEVNCGLYHIDTGKFWCEGVGICTTMESKYRYRNAAKVCPKCGNETIIKGKVEYGGGWLCFAKKGGCGAKFKDGDTSIEGQKVGQVENDNIADTYNTVLKMGKKRAQVDATISATAASDIFTQDIEEMNIVSVGYTVVESSNTPSANVDKPKPAPAQETNDLEIEKFEQSLEIPNLSSVHALAEKNWPLLNSAQKVTLNELFSKAEEMPEGACANWLKMINKEAE
jgi:hypothetical protein